MGHWVGQAKALHTHAKGGNCGGVQAVPVGLCEKKKGACV
jgi:hypothetical protein